MEGLKKQLEIFAPVKTATTFVMYIIQKLLYIVGVVLDVKQISGEKGK